QAELIPQWLLVGFIHGVMNTDNTSVAGETIDYGPCAFMDEYDPEAVFSSIDSYGRYAYFRQPSIAQWNLTRLAECLLPLLADDPEAAAAEANAALDVFAPAFERAYQAGLRRKLGLLTERDGDADLARDLLQAMAANMADFTLTFRGLSESDDAAVRSLFSDPAAFDEWASRWRRRLEEEDADPEARRAAMLATNPAFIPRNHRVEAVIRAAVDRDDLGPFEELLAVLSKPFESQPGFEHYMEPPAAHERVHATFCGT
ncbi:MAG TPA: protein adenylyltransferase SelO family protein, partial [Longimicrobium sp.]